MARSTADDGSELVTLDLGNVVLMGEALALPPPCLSVTGEVALWSEAEPVESLVRFFLRKPSVGIELELLRFRALGGAL